MILTDEQLSAMEHPTRAKRQISSGAKRWVNNTVYYYFDVNITNQDFIRTQLKYISDRTCLKFVENATATNRIKVISGVGCYSYVGMRGGEQELSLAGCNIAGSVVHEFMHALGIQHMHQRSDRDKFVIINMANVNIMLSYASSDGRIKESDFSKAPASVLLFRLLHHRPRRCNHRLRPDNIEDDILASGHLTS
ncbi:hypothetical protein V3C99_009844 [Haemonchus contortus]|uniref:Metalloendopeptidase n=1 Tax=Haemonchus contortus TaxID=6289 RepID=A0A7I4YIF0_HAECO